MIENFNQIKIDSPSDKIIRQIRDLISSGQLKAGDKLPSERKLVERFAVGRSVVRDAIKKLEFYGIVKTHPQSGTVIAGLGLPALEGLITDVLKIEKADFKSLVETRVILEINAAGKAAERRTSKDLIAISDALKAFEQKVRLVQPAVEEDLLFHLKIADASGNKVLKSLMLIIVPDIVKNYNDFKLCQKPNLLKVLEEHRAIMAYIQEGNRSAVEKEMENHLRDVSDFAMSSFKIN